VKKLLKLGVLGSILLLVAQSSVNAVCRRCMVNRQATVEQYIDFEQDGEVAQACVRQVSDKTVVATQAGKQVDKKADKKTGKRAAAFVGKLQDAKAQVAVWAQVAKIKMGQAHVRLAAWTQEKTAWMRAKKQAIAAYIKARRKA
jgi:hypothetical protein